MTCDCDSSGPVCSFELLVDTSVVEAHVQSRPDESKLRESAEHLSLWLVSQNAELRSLLDKLVTHVSLSMARPRTVCFEFKRMIVRMRRKDLSC